MFHIQMSKALVVWGHYCTARASIKDFSKFKAVCRIFDLCLNFEEVELAFLKVVPSSMI